MKPIARADILLAEALITIGMPYGKFVERFGPPHADHPQDWDAPGPVKLWFFELPWGLKVAFEYHLAISEINIYLERFEFEAVLDYLGLKDEPYYIRSDVAVRLAGVHPSFVEGIGAHTLFRQDDNGNKFAVRTFESLRVALYYQRKYEKHGHKQMYWIEPSASENGRTA